MRPDKVPMAHGCDAARSRTLVAEQCTAGWTVAERHCRAGDYTSTTRACRLIARVDGCERTARTGQAQFRLIPIGLAQFLLIPMGQPTNRAISSRNTPMWAYVRVRCVRVGRL